MPILKHCYFCRVQVYNGVKEKVRTDGGKLNYICDTCLQGYWCYCNEPGVCNDRCNDCGEPCCRPCDCANRISLAHNKEGIPYHWIRWLCRMYFTTYYGKCSRYREMKKTVDSIKSGILKPEDTKYHTGSSSGPDGAYYYYIDYLTDKEITVELLYPKANHPPEDTHDQEIVHE